MIAVRHRGRRLVFEEASSYDFIRWNTQGTVAGSAYDALTLFDAEGNRVATFYEWDGVDAGEPS